MNNLPYLLALHSIDGLGPVRLKKIIDFFNDPKLAWEGKVEQFLALNIPTSVVEKIKLARKNLDPEEYANKIESLGIKSLTIYNDNYPELLRQIYDPPVVIYFKGNLLPEDAQSIGIVGTRKITGYGRQATDYFATELSKLGMTIVSGLARGVDTVAHLAAIKENSRTIAVLGGGLNKIFPPENAKLAQQINEGLGAVISEYPPNYASLPGNFPARNRIIAGLSKAVLITEAAEGSGSLITARLALEQGREVFAVPGPISSIQSKGTAQLIREGARLVSTVDDIIEDLGLGKHKMRETSQPLPNPDTIEAMILACLVETKHIDEICRELKISTAEISGSLIKMEILGLVRSLGGGNYIKSM